MNPFGLGANHSPADPRTVVHEEVKAFATPPTNFQVGGYKYLPAEIEHQHTVGICTAISLVQNAEKFYGRKFSPDFQYLLQKKLYDLNWYEGSSIFYALKVGKNVGFLPIELFPYVTEADRTLPYSQYIAKLQAIPDSEIERLKGLCTYKLTGYAQVTDLSTQGVAKAILDSKAGVLTRYEIDQNWWTPSWLPRDIDPLRPPAPNSDGHAINSNYFDYTGSALLEHANTWGTDWDIFGSGHTIHNQYMPTEAWIPYYDFTPIIKQEISLMQQLVILLKKLLGIKGV